MAAIPTCRQQFSQDTVLRPVREWMPKAYWNQETKVAVGTLAVLQVYEKASFAGQSNNGGVHAACEES